MKRRPIARAIENLAPEQGPGHRAGRQGNARVCPDQQLSSRRHAVLHICANAFQRARIFLDTGYHFRKPTNTATRCENGRCNSSRPPKGKRFRTRVRHRILTGPTPQAAANCAKFDPLLGALNPIRCLVTGLRREPISYAQESKKLDFTVSPPAKNALEG